MQWFVHCVERKVFFGISANWRGFEISMFGILGHDCPQECRGLCPEMRLHLVWPSLFGHPCIAERKHGDEDTSPYHTAVGYWIQLFQAERSRIQCLVRPKTESHACQNVCGLFPTPHNLRILKKVFLSPQCKTPPPQENCMHNSTQNLSTTSLELCCTAPFIPPCIPTTNSLDNPYDSSFWMGLVDLLLNKAKNTMNILLTILFASSW